MECHRKKLGMAATFKRVLNICSNRKLSGRVFLQNGWPSQPYGLLVVGQGKQNKSGWKVYDAHDLCKLPHYHHGWGGRNIISRGVIVCIAEPATGYEQVKHSKTLQFTRNAEFRRRVAAGVW